MSEKQNVRMQSMFLGSSPYRSAKGKESIRVNLATQEGEAFSVFADLGTALPSAPAPARGTVVLSPSVYQGNLNLRFVSFEVDK